MDKGSKRTPQYTAFEDYRKATDSVGEQQEAREVSPEEFGRELAQRMAADYQARIEAAFQRHLPSTGKDRSQAMAET